MIKLLSIIIFLLVSFLNAKENPDFAKININEIYILPQDSKIIKDKIEELIIGSKSEIQIAMYNFSYKKYAKALVKTSKKGVDITILLDSEKIKKDDEIYKYLKNNGIKTIISNRKMHIKAAVFDKEIAILGSINWTKDSFDENNEVVLLTKDKKVIFRLRDFIKNN